MSKGIKNLTKNNTLGLGEKADMAFDSAYLALLKLKETVRRKRAEEIIEFINKFLGES